jgi:hemerythrin-like metal-binding protein
MGEFKPSEALRVHAAFCRVFATAVSVMTTSGEDIGRDTLTSLGIDPGQFHQQLRLTIQRKVRGERTKLPPIDWVSALAVGVEAIDEQHRQLFSLLNEFQKASSADSDESLLRETVNELVEYTKIHFAFEETLLAKHEYPDIEPHKLAHMQLAVQVNRYAESAKFGAGPLSSELYFFLRTWLNGHIRGTDRRYGAYLNARGVS